MCPLHSKIQGQTYKMYINVAELLPSSRPSWQSCKFRKVALKSFFFFIKKKQSRSNESKEF